MVNSFDGVIDTFPNKPSFSWEEQGWGKNKARHVSVTKCIEQTMLLFGIKVLELVYVLLHRFS